MATFSFNVGNKVVSAELHPLSSSRGAPVDFSQGGDAKASLTWTCAWADGYDLAAWLLGLPEGPDFTGDMRDPQEYPGLSLLKCLSARVVGKGQLTVVAGSPTYPEAMIEASYGIPPYAGHGSTPSGGEIDLVYGSESRRSQIEYLVLEGDTYRYGQLEPGTEGKGDPIDQPVGKVIVQEMRTFELTRLESIDWEALRNAAGQVNLDRFANCNPAFLLFAGHQLKNSLSLGFAPSPVLTLEFIERRPIPWNYVWRPGFVNPYTQDICYNTFMWPIIPNVYEYAEFASLFGSAIRVG